MADVKKNDELQDDIINTEENTDKVIDKIEDTEVEKSNMENANEESKNDEHIELKEQLKKEITNELKAELTSSNEETEEMIKTGFFGNLAISFIDLVVSVGIAFALYMLAKFILKFVGYDIVDTFGIYLIVYVITNLLYRPALKALKMEETVGEKVLNIK